MTKQAARSTTGRGIQGSDPHTSSRVPVQRKKKDPDAICPPASDFPISPHKLHCWSHATILCGPLPFQQLLPKHSLHPKTGVRSRSTAASFSASFLMLFPSSAPPRHFELGNALPYTCPANSQVFEKSFVHARRPFVTNALLTRARSPRQPSRTANPPSQMSLLIVEKRETKRKSACARQRDRDRARA